MNSRAWMALLGPLALAACESLPPLEYESEHALVGSDQVDRVCAGSLERIDLAIEYVDQRLDKQTGGEPARIYVLSREEVYDRCSLTDRLLAGCYIFGDVYIAAGEFEETLVHEVVHERIGRTAARNSKALFSEGIASALGHAHKPPSADESRSAVDSYISATLSKELSDLSYGYYYSGELTHWLIETHGIAKVLEFMDEVSWANSASKVRDTYAAHFGSSIDDDLFAHAREEGELNRFNAVCTGPELTIDPQRQRVRLQANLSCDSPQVENNWVSRDRVYVEWTVKIGADQVGHWAPVRRAGDDAIPSGTLLEIEQCGWSADRRRKWSNGSNPTANLKPGLHRIRWHGVMDEGAELDIELGGPCDVLAQDCEVGERCIEPGVCEPLVQ